MTVVFDKEEVIFIKSVLCLALMTINWVGKYRALENAQLEKMQANNPASAITVDEIPCAYSDSPGLFVKHLMEFAFATTNAIVATACGNPTLNAFLQNSNVPEWAKSNVFYQFNNVFSAFIAAGLTLLVIEAAWNTPHWIKEGVDNCVQWRGEREERRKLLAKPPGAEDLEKAPINSQGKGDLARVEAPEIEISPADPVLVLADLKKEKVCCKMM